MLTLVNFTVKENKKLLTLIVLPVFLTLLYVLTFWPLPAGLALAALLFVLVLVARIEWGVYLIAFFLPVIHWDFFIWKLQIPLIDLVALLVLIAFCLRYALLTFLAPEELRPRLVWPYPRVFAFFFLAVLLSSFFSPTILDSAWYGIRWILFFYLSYLLLPLNIIQSEAVLKRTLVAVVLSATLVSLMSLASLYGQDWRNEFVRIKPIAVAGVYPFGENQNLIVEVVLPAIFYVLALKQFARSPRLNRFLNLIFLLLVTVLVGTFSRGGWLALAFCLTLLAVYRYRQQIRYLLLPLALAGLALVPVAYYMYLMQTDYHIGIGSNQSRVLSSQIAYDAFRDKPLLGNGSGEYMNLVGNNVRFRAKFGEPLESHGIVQKVMAENGSLGLLGFGLFVALIFRYFYQACRRLKKYDLLYLYLVLAGTSVFIFELFNTSYYKGKLWFPLGLALVAAGIYLNKEKHEKSQN